MIETSGPPALQLHRICVHYGPARRRRGSAPTVEEVSFEVASGETVGLVGESGAGKSTIVKSILGLAAPSAGSITVNGRDVTHQSATQRRSLVGELSAVFQDPFSSLSPFQTVGATLLEPLRNRDTARGKARQLAGDALGAVGLSPHDLDRYPDQFSGGQRQRIALARALVGNPHMVVMDEPVSALDLSTQAQVLNLLVDLRETRRYGLLFVAHDLGVVRFLCQRVIVLYRGAVMEIGPAGAVTADPKHPYTAALVATAPVPRPAEQAKRRAARRTLLVQRAATPESGNAGCPFAPRCPGATDLCRTQRPALRRLDDRSVACHYAS